MYWGTGTNGAGKAGREESGASGTAQPTERLEGAEAREGDEGAAVRLRLLTCVLDPLTDFLKGGLAEHDQDPRTRRPNFDSGMTLPSSWYPPDPSKVLREQPG